MPLFPQKLYGYVSTHRKGFSIACFAFLFIAFFVATWCGLGKTTDSHKYLGTAQKFLSSGDFSALGEKPYTYWPPLFPIVLALVPNQSLWLIGLMNSACLLGSLLLWHRIARHYLTPTWRLFYLFTLCSATPILMVHVFVWTEPIFLFLLSGYLYSFHRFWRANLPKWLVSATVCAFFLMLQRNAGTMLFGGMSLGLLIFGFPLFKKHLGKFLAHGIFSVSGWGAWQYWQYIIQEHSETIDYFFITEIDWLKYEAFLKAWYTHWFPRDAPGAVIGFVILVIVLGILGRKTTFDPYQKSLWLMIVLYVFLLLAMPFTTHRDAIRYQAIFIPPLFLNILFMLQKPFRTLSARWQLIAASFLLVWMLYPLARIAWNTLHWHRVFCGEAAFF